jgi:hypothetical protein
MTFTARVNDALALLRAKHPAGAIRRLHGSVVLDQAWAEITSPNVAERTPNAYRVIVPRREKA